eukprot:3170653-Alexandrium_andersonii.AAC.1
MPGLPTRRTRISTGPPDDPWAQEASRFGIVISRVLAGPARGLHLLEYFGVAFVGSRLVGMGSGGRMGGQDA